MVRATVLFPGDYFSMNNPNDNFTCEMDAAVSCPQYDVLLFNFDEFYDGGPLRLSKPVDQCAEALIYRGWMVKPDVYKRFYSEFVGLGFSPVTTPAEYERMHCFPNAAKSLVGLTPSYLVFPKAEGSGFVDATEVNEAFDRFMIKDYVKSVKGTSFPNVVSTPVSQERLDNLIRDFVQLRGDLFTGGIVIKEHVNLRRYADATNEWREFRFFDKRLALSRNSNQPADCPPPSDEFLQSVPAMESPFYTVDYAELEDGSWTIVEVGDGGVSGLAASESPMAFYEELAILLSSL